LGSYENYVEEKHPTSKAELIRFVHEAWEKVVTLKLIRSVIDHVQRYLPKVLEKQGGYAD